MRELFKERGSGTYEFLVIVFVCLIITVIVLLIVINVDKQTSFQVFKYNAKIIGINAINYNDETVYLYEMINDNLVTNMKNTFSDDEFCNIYDSKVEFKDDKRLVTFRCGDYLIYNQDITKKDYNLYKVSDWAFKEKTGSHVDVTVLYTLFKDGKQLLNGYYEKNLFIRLVMDSYGSKYNNLKEIKKDYEVKEKKAYRKRVLVN